jgi:hypothetical protein
MDETQQIFFELVKTAKVRLENKIVDIEHIIQAAGKATAEFTAYQTALEQYSKSANLDYTPLPNPWEVFWERQLQNFKFPSFQRLVGEVNSQLPPRLPRAINLQQSGTTKAGAVRTAFQSNTSHDWSIDDLLEAIPADRRVTRDDLWRILPRLTKRGEITRVKFGFYRMASSDSTADLFTTMEGQNESDGAD